MSGDCEACGEHCLECTCQSICQRQQNIQWNNVEKEIPENECKKYLVKTSSGQIKNAFFMPDRANWRAWYGLPTSYWLETPSAKLILDVVEWSLDQQ